VPVGKGRFRVVTRGGKKVRLHFTPGGKVNEAKNLKIGAVHTPAEFKADEKKKKLPKRGSGELTPLGSRTLAGYQQKWGDGPGHDKFEAAVKSGILHRSRMFKDPEKAKV
jgi:hypothetical protein